MRGLKNYLILLVFIVCFFSVGNFAHAEKITNPNNAHSYEIIDTPMSWADAKTYCENLGGHLVTIESQDEQNFINQILTNGTKQYYWTGAYQPSGSSEPDGNWKWVTGEEFSYTNWRDCQPDNWSGDNVAFMIRDIDWFGTSSQGKWADDIESGGFSSELYGFICEWEASYANFQPNVYDLTVDGSTTNITRDTNSYTISAKGDNCYYMYAVVQKPDGETIQLPKEYTNTGSGYNYSASYSFGDVGIYKVSVYGSNTPQEGDEGFLSSTTNILNVTINNDTCTKLLLHADGSNGCTTFIDSATGKTIAADGSAQISTAQNKFGGSSAYFDGSGSYLSVANSSDFDFGTGDFTVDFWFYPISESRMGLFTGSSDYWFGIDYNYNGVRNINLYASSNGTSWDLINADPGGNGIGNLSLNLNEWNHIAVVRNGNRWMTFINGIKDKDITIEGSIVTKDEDKRIGLWGNYTNPTNGYIDEFRVSKGLARWTTDFTPPFVPYGCRSYANSQPNVYDLAVDGATSDITRSTNLYTISAKGDNCNYIYAVVQKPSGEIVKLPKQYTNAGSGYNYSASYFFGSVGTYKVWVYGSNTPQEGDEGFLSGTSNIINVTLDKVYNLGFDVAESGFYDSEQCYYAARDTQDLTVGSIYTVKSTLGYNTSFKMSTAVDANDGDISQSAFKAATTNSYTFRYTQAMKDANMKLYMFVYGTSSVYDIDITKIGLYQGTGSNIEKTINLGNGHSYALIDSPISWTDAEVYCESQGGHLVTVTSQDEQDFINGLLSSGEKKYYWMGGYQPDNSQEPAEGWNWVTGEEFSYTNWHYTQPDNYIGDNIMAMIRDTNWSDESAPGKWMDEVGYKSSEASIFGFICEWDNIPSYASSQPNVYDLTVDGSTTDITRDTNSYTINAKGDNCSYMYAVVQKPSGEIVKLPKQYTNAGSGYNYSASYLFGSVGTYKVWVYGSNTPEEGDEGFLSSTTNILNVTTKGATNLGFNVAESGYYSPEQFYYIARDTQDLTVGCTYTIKSWLKNSTIYKVNYKMSTYINAPDGSSEVAFDGEIDENYTFTYTQAMRDLNMKLYIFAYGSSSVSDIDVSKIALYQGTASDMESTTNPGSGHTYALIDNSMNWTDAEAYCESMGGHLATVTSQDEQDFVEGLLPSGTKTYYWIGGYQPDGSSEPADNWSWITGETFSYTNWHYTQPDNYLNDNIMAMIRDTNWSGESVPGQWIDDIGSGSSELSVYGFICEWDYNTELTWLKPEIKNQTFFGEEGTNVATGNFSRTYADMTVSSPGFKLDFSRTYNSRDNNAGPDMGKGWTFGFKGSIEDDQNDSTIKIVRLPDGSICTFTKNDDGTYSANDSRNMLEKQADDTFILTSKDQSTFGFSTNGWLVWMKDKNGNTVNINVDSSTGKVNSITDAAGRQYTVAYNAQGFISSVTDPSGRTVQYEYDNNLLARAIDPMGKITRYSYDSNGVLTEVRDNDNNLIESIDTYTDGDNQGKVHQTTDAYGNTKTYAYDTANRKTTITDSNGRQTITWYDQFYYPTKIRDAEGKDTTTEYFLYNGVNKYGDEKTVADRNGNLTQYERDSNGNITKVTNPDQSVKLMTYDDKNNLLSEKDEDGKYTFYVYDADKKNLVKKVQPLNGTDEYSEGADQSLFAITNYTYYTEEERQQLDYNAKGLLKTETDPEGKTTVYAYNANGNPTSVTDPENNTTTYGYNEIGLKTSEVSPKGYNTQYVYDLNGNIEKTTLNNGETTRTTYDSMGRKTKEISPNLYDSSLDDLANHTYTGDQGARYTYYTNGLIHTVTDPEGNTTSYTYDIYGNKLTETKSNGAVYVYEYDVMDRLSKAYFKEDANSQAELTDEYAYETLADGKTQITHTQYLNDSETAVTANTYDYAQRQVAQQNPDSTTKTIVYNPNGTISSSNDENNSTTYYKYDGLNRLTEQWTPFEDNNGTLYTYTSTTYDKAGKKISTSVGKDKVSLYEVPVNQITQTNEYYNNGLLKAAYNNAGSRTDYEYDQDGNVSKESVCTAVYEGVASKNIIEFVNNHFGKPTEKKVHVKVGELSGNDFNDTQDTILTTAYTYDADGNVKTQTTPDNVTTTYTYDRMDRKTLEGLPVEDENGNTVTAEVYSGYDWDGKIAFKTDANGNTTTYAYDKKGNLKTVTDAEDGIAAYYYDKAGRKIAEVSANNYDAAKTLEEMNRTEYAYDPMNRVITVTNKYKDQDGGWRTIVSKAYKYDSKGNVVKELTALGYSAASGDCAQQKIDTGYGTEYTYNLANKVVTVLDPVSKDRELAFTTKNEYDAAGRITTETNAAGVVKTSNYDDSDNLTSVTIKKTANDPEKTIQLNTYDLAGNKLTATDGNGNTTAYEYNAFNKLRKAVYPGDSSIASNTVTYQYDDMENLKKQQDSEGTVDLYTYDSMNRQTSHTQEKADDSEAITTSIKYDKNGNKRFETDANGNVTINTYDGLNRLETVTDAVYHTTTNIYDANGNLIETTNWRGNSYDNVYDPLNRLIEKVDPFNVTIQTLNYNDDGAQIKSYDALNNLTQYTYDKNNRLLETADPRGDTTSQAYDNVGNIQTKTDARGKATTYSYDEFNRLESVTNAKDETTNYTYDLNGNMLTQIDAKNNTTAYEYNCSNKAKKMTDANEKEETYTYNSDGSIAEKTDRNGITTTYEYDIHGRLISQQTGDITIEYTYDNNGNQLTMTDETGTTQREYDDINRVVRKTVPDIGVTYYDYDIIESSGKVAERTTDPRGNATKKVYDKAGRLYKVEADGDATLYSYYDNGRLESVDYPDGSVEQYTYYDDNLLHTLTNRKPSGEIIGNYSYSYDAAHNQTSKADNKGTTNYTYDSLNRLETVSEPTGKTTTYTYDAAGNRETESITENSNTITSTYTYNEQNRLINKSQTPDGGTILEAENGVFTGNAGIYSDDSASNDMGVGYIETIGSAVEFGNVEQTSRLIVRYATCYNGQLSLYVNNVHTQDVSFPITNSWGGNYQDKVINVDIPQGAAVRFQYDDGDAAVNIDYIKIPGQGAIDYTYDNNGNQLTETSNGQTTVNTYDKLNQLIQTQTADGKTITNTYNGEGLRVAKNVDGETTRYLYDCDKVMLELDADGNQVAKNVQGTNLIARSADGQTGYYFYNGHGDVTTITKAVYGDTLASYYYDAFGNIETVQGSVYDSVYGSAFPNPFRFAGYMFDPETGNYYLMARYYDPETARFLSEDSYRGQASDPLSLNLYTYCHNEPVMYEDPNGHLESNLSKGSKGDDVEKLQKMLVKAGYLKMPKNVSYGYFGDLTEKAVNAYKKDHDLTNSGKYKGVVGNTTMLSLSFKSNSSSNAMQTIKDVFKTSSTKTIGNNAYAIINTIAVASNSSKVGDFSNIKGSSLQDVMSRLPSNAQDIGFKPTSRISEGVQYSWKDANGTRWNIRAHGPDSGAPEGSNSSKGWSVRVQRGNEYLTKNGKWVTSKNATEEEWNDSHIPIKTPSKGKDKKNDNNNNFPPTGATGGDSISVTSPNTQEYPDIVPIMPINPTMPEVTMPEFTLPEFPIFEPILGL